MVFGSVTVMRRAVKLLTTEGNLVRILLDNWGSGLDHAMRRWILQEGLWQCMDSGDLAEERVFSLGRPVIQLSHASAAQDAHEKAVALMRGQTMMEYALIIAAIGVVAWGA